MVTVDLQTVASVDDCSYDATSGNWSTTAQNPAFASSGYQLHTGHRFGGVLIPPGSTITSASIEWHAYTNRSGTAPGVIISGELSADAGTFDPTASGYIDFLARTRTTASETCTVGNQVHATWYDTIADFSCDIKAVIQEIIDQGSWSYGNALVIFTYHDGVIGSTRQFNSWDAGSNIYGMKLHVTYTAPADSVSYQMVSGADDGHIIDPGNHFESTLDYIKIGRGSDSDVFWSWFRFQNVTIPTNANITKAYLVVYVEGSVGSSSSSIYAVKAANPAAPTSYAEYTAASLSTTHVEWPMGDDANYWATSPDISTIIQELVNSYNYASGAAMMFQERIVAPPTNQYRQSPSYEDGAANSAILYIEYEDIGSTPEDSRHLPKHVCILVDGGFSPFLTDFNDPTLGPDWAGTQSWYNIAGRQGITFLPRYHERDKKKGG